MRKAAKILLREAKCSVARHGRYVAFQVAEVAIPRTLFTGILRLIAELRAPADTATA